MPPIVNKIQCVYAFVYCLSVTIINIHFTIDYYDAHKTGKEKNEKKNEELSVKRMFFEWFSIFIIL